MNKLPILTNEPVNQQMKNMQNEPNLQNAQINITTVPGKAYMENDAFSSRQNEPNLQNAQINITTVPIKDYIKNDAFAPPKNKPNSNPIKPNFAENKPNSKPISNFLLLRVGKGNS